MEERKHHQAQLGMVVGLILIYLLWRQPAALYAASGAGLFFLLFPAWAKYVSTAWWKLAAFMGKVNGAVLLSLLFFLVLTPLALLRRIFQRKKAEKPSSYYFVREHRFKAEDLEHPF